MLPMSLTIPIDGRLKASSKQDIIDAIMMLPGIECVVVSPAERSVAVTGADLDYLSICDTIEDLGFTIIR
jgi:hypothetical protein